MKYLTPVISTTTFSMGFDDWELFPKGAKAVVQSIQESGRNPAGRGWTISAEIEFVFSIVRGAWYVVFWGLLGLQTQVCVTLGKSPAKLFLAWQRLEEQSELALCIRSKLEAGIALEVAYQMRYGTPVLRPVKSRIQGPVRKEIRKHES